jgi:hypothetical protein
MQFNSGPEECMTYHVQISIKPTEAEQHYIETPNTEFHQNQEMWKVWIKIN